MITHADIDPCRAIFTAISKKQKANFYVSRQPQSASFCFYPSSFILHFSSHGRAFS
jgi:hypothetical protein